MSIIISSFIFSLYNHTSICNFYNITASLNGCQTCWKITLKNDETVATYNFKLCANSHRKLEEPQSTRICHLRFLCITWYSNCSKASNDGSKGIFFISSRNSFKFPS